MSEVKVGSDPEVFLVDPKSGEVITAEGRLGGTKDKPRKVVHGMIHEDNILAELNTIPADNRHDFIRNTSDLLEELRGLVAPYKLLIAPSQEFSESQLYSFGFGAMEFGCEPDTDAWTGMANFMDGKENVLFRTGGGHIHIGSQAALEHPDEVVRMFDIVAAIPSVILDSDTKRRSLYGAAGSMRRKPYGVECRVLSNFWLNNDSLMGWVYDRAVEASRRYSDVNDIIQEYGAGFLKSVINNGERENAEMLVRDLKLVMP
jgi:hypothetical protein